MTRTEAARTNGALSHGPVTQEGKARSSRNALKHGLTSQSVVLASESQEEFDRLLEDLRSIYQPAGPLESEVLFSLAAARWRLRRIQCMEKAVFDEQYTILRTDPDNSLDHETALALAFSRVASGPALNRLHRFEMRLLRQCDLFERQFYTIQADRFEAAQQSQRQIEPDVYPNLPLPAPPPNLPAFFASSPEPLPLPQPDNPGPPATPWMDANAGTPAGAHMENPQADADPRSTRGATHAHGIEPASRHAAGLQPARAAAPHSASRAIHAHPSEPASPSLAIPQPPPAARLNPLRNP